MILQKLPPQYLGTNDMLKVYGLLIILAVLGGVAYGAKYYYDTTQNTTHTKKNNATLKAAAETAEASIATLQLDMKKLSI